MENDLKKDNDDEGSFDEDNLIEEDYDEEN